MELGTFAKSCREEIRLTLDTFKGVELVNIRVWYRSDDGDYRPSKKGVAFKLDLLPHVIEALRKALKGGEA